tara:strand:- start:160 stop:636 length:477 start_codon:yes stop_codon:yes gene_type:complete
MRILHFLAFLLVLQSCNKNAYEAPVDLIPEDQMVEILSDLMILNSAQGANKKILEDRLKNPLGYVFKKYNIDSTQFENSNAYYARNIDQYSLIYQLVKEKLDNKKKRIQKRIEIQNKVADSLRKLKRDSLTKTRGKNRILTQNPVKKNIEPLVELPRE